MGIYREQILPRIIDKSLGSEGIAGYRREVAADLAGEVVEIGFGSGLNMPEYPSEVTKVYAVEPAAVGMKLAAERVARSPIRTANVFFPASVSPGMSRRLLITSSAVAHRPTATEATSESLCTSPSST